MIKNIIIINAKNGKMTFFEFCPPACVSHYSAEPSKNPLFLLCKLNNLAYCSLCTFTAHLTLLSF